jgi:hypothetical protein
MRRFLILTVLPFTLIACPDDDNTTTDDDDAAVVIETCTSPTGTAQGIDFTCINGGTCDMGCTPGQIPNLRRASLTECYALNGCTGDNTTCLDTGFRLARTAQRSSSQTPNGPTGIYSAISRSGVPCSLPFAAQSPRSASSSSPPVPPPPISMLT